MYPLKRNDNGGLYSDGVGFDESKWAEIQCLYAQEIRQNGTCTIKALAKEAKVGYSSARKAIKAYHDGELNPTSLVCGYVFEKEINRYPDHF